MTPRENRIDLTSFVRYKFFNALFMGLSVGSIFIIYAPLPPSVYSLGGIVLALSMLAIAKLYVHILNRIWFYRISLFVELVMLVLVLYFLSTSYGYATALFIYAGYQLTFAFGSYLVRAETVLIEEAEALSRLDVAKQLGYLAGMVVSYLFYKLLETAYGLSDHQRQVYDLHYLLLMTELAVLFFLYKAFHPKTETIT